MDPREGELRGSEAVLGSCDGARSADGGVEGGGGDEGVGEEDVGARGAADRCVAGILARQSADGLAGEDGALALALREGLA